MTAFSTAKGPASAATDPGHGSNNSREEITVNKMDRITKSDEASISPELEARIEAHRLALAASASAFALVEDAIARLATWMAQEPIRVETPGMPFARVYLDGSVASCKAELMQLAGREMANFMLGRANGSDERSIEAAAAEVAAHELLHLEKLRVAVIELDRRREAAGLTTAECAHDEACTAEWGALDAVLCFRPQSLADVRRVAAYLDDESITFALLDDDLRRLFGAWAGGEYVRTAA